MVKPNKAMEKRGKPITQDRLMRAAMHYLGRFESHQVRLTEVLKRKVERWSGSRDISDYDAAISAVVSKCLDLDLVSDARFADSRVRAMARRGKAPRIIVQDLRARGLGQDVIDTALAQISGAHERESLVRLAQRRRIGVYRSRREADRYQADPRKGRDRELGALMRAGHSFQNAASFLDLLGEGDVADWLLDG